jgi:hypothetical protein
VDAGLRRSPRLRLRIGGLAELPRWLRRVITINQSERYPASSQCDASLWDHIIALFDETY